MRRRMLLSVLVFGLLFSLPGLGQTLYKETFEKTDPPALPKDWSRNPNPTENVMGTVCWKVVSAQNLFGENLPPFPSGSRAAYFGRVDLARGKGDYDGGGVEVFGWLSNPEITVNFPKFNQEQPDRGFIELVFWSLREVEYYPAKEFDITEVYVDGKKVWCRTSKDKSQRVWEKISAGPILVDHGSTVALDFFFDSVDSYNNRRLGWLIDDVELRVAPLVIDTHVLPAGKVGEQYDANILLRGGIPLKESGTDYYLRTCVVSGQLPPRLQLRRADLKGDQYEALISGEPEEPGEYEFTVEFEDLRGEKARRTYTITVYPADDVGETGAQIIFSTDFSGSQPLSGWSVSGLWHYEEWFEDQDNVAAYFNPTTGYYDTGARTFGYLTSPEISVARYAGSNVEVSFLSWREVENYDKGKYDITFVEVSFNGGPWNRVWEKTSADGPEPFWQPETTEDLAIPPTATVMRVRFGFDSVDRYNNQYRGWAIDDVEVRVVTGTLEILTETRELPMAEVGVPYRFQFQARGGVPPYLWSADSRLPAELRLDRYTGELTGTPTEEGEVEFTLTVEDATGQTASEEFILVITEKVTLFADAFDNGLGNWSEENLGLWHITTTVPGVNLAGRGGVAYYGHDDTGNYNTGARTVGYLTSNPFETNGAKAFAVEFEYWREVEYYALGGYDKTYVEVRFLAGGSWSGWYRIWFKDSATPSEKAWTEASAGPYTIPSSATKMQIRFVFDSVDRFYNNYVGWLIDNVKVTKATSGSPLPTTALETLAKPRGDFAVFNVPNPVRDVHTTTFVVRGVEADLIRVEVYDLTGRLVYAGEASGNELTWHTQDLFGQYLANGVYLYKVLVKVGDTWIVSDVQKLVILR